jgi:TatD DNase family protein
MTNKLNLFDIHAHLQDEKFTGEVEQIVENASAAGVSKILNVGTCIKTSEQAIQIANQYSGCFAAIGIHPHDANSFNNDSLTILEKQAKHQKVIAIGEIGFDFYYNYSAPETQEKVFVEMWQLAVKLGLPVVIHIREAFDRFFSVIKNLPKTTKTLLHCFSGDLEIAKKAADMGFHFSIGGVLTFKKSDAPREIFSWLPIELIHLETDCPYLAPVPKRGKRNEPALLPYVFETLAQIRNISPEKLEQQLLVNAKNLFGLETL